MFKRAVVIFSAVLLCNAIPAHAGVHFEWLSPLRSLGPVGSSVGSAYNPPGDKFDPTLPGPGWFDLGSNSDFDFFDDPAFVLQSDSGQAGLVPVNIKTILSGNAAVDEDNAKSTQFQISERLTYTIMSFNGLYNKEFNMDADFLSPTSYGRTDSFLEFLEIGQPYAVSGLLASFSPFWEDSMPIDADSPGHSIIFNDTSADITFSVVPEPPTLLLFASGSLGMWIRRRGKKRN